MWLKYCIYLTNNLSMAAAFNKVRIVAVVFNATYISVIS